MIARVLRRPVTDGKTLVDKVWGAYSCTVLLPYQSNLVWSRALTPVPQRSASSSTEAQDRNSDVQTKFPESSSAMLVDTLSLMKALEGNGLSREQAEVLTRHLTQLMMAQTDFNRRLFVSKDEMERVVIQLDSKHKHFRQEIQVTHEVHSVAMSKESERLNGLIDAFKSDIKHEVDKLTANQKLDLNLERGRLRDDLQLLRDKLTTLRANLEREVNLVRTDMESSKSDTLKWVTVTLVGLLGAGFAAIRLAMA